MDFLQRTCRDIRSLKIQGAEHVATAAIEALAYVLSHSKAESKKSLVKEAERAQTLLLATRPTEPEMENYLNAILQRLRTGSEADPKRLKSELSKEISNLLRDKRSANERIAQHGIGLVPRSGIVYTHCHSSTVTHILRDARRKKSFVVHNTETRPLYQGRKTAQELAHARIPVKHYVDSAARLAVKDADVMLIGADSITYNHVYNKIGSEMIALIARECNVPVYVCASLWKFMPHPEEIEQRSPREVWGRPPKGVHIMNPAFEPIPFSLIKGIVCEEGVLKPKAFVKRARRLLR